MAEVTHDYLSPETLLKVSTFELRAKMIVEGVRSGMHQSPYQGVSVEFAQHRQYVHGDDTRHLDWKVYARSDKLYLKQYQQETNLDVMILVDSSGSMGYGTLEGRDAKGRMRTWRKFDHATACAAAMAHLALRQGDRVGLCVYADGIRSLVNRSSAGGHWRQIVSALSTQPVERPTNLGRSMDQVLAKLNNRVLIVLLSDLFEEVERVRTAMARARHRGHDLILMQVLDAQERTFRFRSPSPFEGLEAEGRVFLDPRVLRKEYLRIVEEHCEALDRAARGFGYDYQGLNSHEPLGAALGVFLARRMSRLSKR